ncbi:MAG: DUF512 domain-containing protein [Acidimicrobiia bacterium]|nr:DUF512 domain-containing protein [Acidimicrobiia bacterium]
MHVRISSVQAASPAAHVGLGPGDEVVAIDDVTPRDVLDYARLAAEPNAVARLADGREVPVAGLSGATLDASAFDGVQTCDNHCEFCFIHQLPKGMRRSLYLRDDDYRLSAMYGNFTTLTRFTELDLERVLDERISPLHVSIHATDPGVRARMLRNPKGATSLRWMRALLDGGIDLHGQIVLCPGVNDGGTLDATLADLLAGWPEILSIGVVPLGLSRFNTETDLRVATREEARATVDAVHLWQERALREVGRRFVFAADELYLLADEPFPPADTYEGFPQHENGIGMARALEGDLTPEPTRARGAPAWGYRPVRAPDAPTATRGGRGAIVTGELGARVIAPLVRALGSDADIVPVANRYFGGNVSVTGLLTGVDVVEALRGLDADVTAVLPDVLFADGRTLDDYSIERIEAETERTVRIVTTDAAGLREATSR